PLIMPGSSAAGTATTLARRTIEIVRKPMEVSIVDPHCCSSACRDLLPLAILFFPIVKRFAVNLMNGRVCDFHCAWRSGQKEIDVVGFAIRSFHIYAGKVLAPAEIGQAIVVYSYQIERKITALVLDVELSVAALFAFSINVFLDAGGNISGAYLFFRTTFLRVFRAFLWMLWMFLRGYCRSRCEKQRHRKHNNKSCNHKIRLLRFLYLNRKTPGSLPCRLRISTSETVAFSQMVPQI